MDAREIFKQLTCGAIFKKEVNLRQCESDSFHSSRQSYYVFEQAKKPEKIDAKIEIKTEDEDTNDAADIVNAKRKPKVMTEEKQKMLHIEKVKRSSDTSSDISK